VSKPITTDPATLSNLISGLGGTVIPGETFCFDLPLSAVRTAVPKINELGINVRKISERVEDNPTKLFSPITVARLELYISPETRRDRLPEW
jgi:hypothetical protein